MTKFLSCYDSSFERSGLSNGPQFRPSFPVITYAIVNTADSKTIPVFDFCASELSVYISEEGYIIRKDLNCWYTGNTGFNRQFRYTASTGYYNSISIKMFNHKKIPAMISAYRRQYIRPLEKNI